MDLTTKNNPKNNIVNTNTSTSNVNTNYLNPNNEIYSSKQNKSRSSSTSKSNNQDITSESKQLKSGGFMNSQDEDDPNNPDEINTCSKDSLSMEYSKYIVFCAFVASIASFNTGYTTAVTNVPNDTIQGKTKNGKCGDSFFKDCIYTPDDFIWGLAIGMFALGGFFGSLLIGKFSDNFGRKNAIIFANIPFVIGSVFLSTANSIYALGAGRFFCGASSGAGSVVVSSYIGEIASVKRRGVLGSILQFSVVTGIFISTIVGYLSVTFGGAQTWRFLLAFTGVLALIQVSVLFKCIETPRYLIMKGSIQLAHRALQRLRKGYNIEKEFEQMVSHSSYSSDNLSGDNKPLTVLQALKEIKYLKNIIVIIIIQVTQQFSGINGVISYSSTFFNSILGPEYSYLCTILVTLLNLIATIVSMYLIDKIGRKSLLLVSCFGIFISTVAMTIGILFEVKALVVIFILVFIVTFAVGLGPIPWILISEMFPTKMLSAIASLSLGINWLCHFIITTSFLWIKTLLGDYVFLPFSLIGLLGFFFVMFLLKETKGRTLENILEDSK